MADNEENNLDDYVEKGRYEVQDEFEEKHDHCLLNAPEVDISWSNWLK